MNETGNGGINPLILSRHYIVNGGELSRLIQQVQFGCRIVVIYLHAMNPEQVNTLDIKQSQENVTYIQL